MMMIVLRKSILRPTESVISAVLSKIGARITDITRTTQDAIAAAVTKGYDEGLSPAQIADLIEELPAFDEARAELVARTETMFAYNDAALESYSGFGVTEVEAIDGDEDEECAARNGQIYSVEDAAGIEDHPNGTLDWVPVLEPKARLDPMIEVLKALAMRPEPTITIPVQITTPEVTYTAPDIHVTTPDVHVAPAEVNVAAPQVIVPPMRTVVDRDGAGRITGSHEELV